MWTTYVWISVIVMCVISADAGTIKRSVSNPITKERWVFIPSHATPNDTWIPIPADIFYKSNETFWRDHFQLMYMTSHGVLSNDSFYSFDDGLSTSFMGYVMIVGVVLLSMIAVVIVKLMQSDKCKSRYQPQHGQKAFIP